jgi:hypothetical protein
MHKIERVLQFIIDFMLPKLTNTNMDISYLQGPIETLYRTKKKNFFFSFQISSNYFRCN